MKLPNPILWRLNVWELRKICILHIHNNLSTGYTYYFYSVCWTQQKKTSSEIDNLIHPHLFQSGARGSVVVEALCYKPEGRRCESRMRWIFFNLPNPSSRIMALGSTQPLTEMSSRNLPGGKKRPARRADNLATIYEPNVWKCGSFNLSQP
jgi:hypothetical protein